jgi:hypothetical protein
MSISPQPVPAAQWHGQNIVTGYVDLSGSG